MTARFMCLVALSAALAAPAAAQTPPAQSPPDLRKRLETVLATSKSLNVPPDIDRACVIREAMAAHPKVTRMVDGMMGKLFTPKDQRAKMAQTRSEMKDTFAVASGIDACTPKTAKSVKAPAR